VVGYTLSYFVAGPKVWSTGLGVNPFTRRVQWRLGHAERRALSVDHFLRVRGAQGIYALGDCSDVKEGRDLHSSTFRSA